MEVSHSSLSWIVSIKKLRTGTIHSFQMYIMWTLEISRVWKTSKSYDHSVINPELITFTHQLETLEKLILQTLFKSIILVLKDSKGQNACMCVSENMYTFRYQKENFINIKFKVSEECKKKNFFGFSYKHLKLPKIPVKVEWVSQ